jgi:hypothetical protein
VRKKTPDKIRALLQKEIVSKCPFRGNEDADLFEVHHIDGNNENTVFRNLIMLCPLCHSKITKGDISGAVENVITGDYNTVTIIRKTNKKK